MTYVVKIGGGVDVATEAILDEVAQLVTSGQRLVLVHGGSDLTNSMSERLGHPVRTVTSPNGMTSRYTDAETLRIFAMSVVGEINTSLVAGLQRRSVNALGLSGVDGRLLLARRKATVRTVTPEGRTIVLRDDHTGQIESVDDVLLKMLMSVGYTPVIAPLALSYEGERLNVDGDRAAAAIAAALHSEALAIMTNVPGLLSNPGDLSSVISHIPSDYLDEYMHYAQGRMRKKLLGAQEAIEGGVPRVLIGSRSLSAVLNGAGTTIEAVPVVSSWVHQFAE
ncbi:MAG: [LysW]-aminoadipate kinase [Chloroflexota bacterium]|nr:[LysW]-aminoadipate kinase [Chloroflexota bacterium]